jgi:uncharacterized HAD superfamily protein
MILIDIDGVLADSEAVYRTILSDMYGTMLVRPQRTYGFSDHFTPGQVKAMLEVFYAKHLMAPKQIPLARDAVTLLLKDHEVTFVTARPERTREGTKAWLNHNGFHAPVYFTGKKLEFAKSKNAFLIVEDKLATANTFAEAGVAALLYNQRWNRLNNTDQTIHPDVIRVFDWMHAYDEIEKIVSGRVSESGKLPAWKAEANP